MRHVPRSRPRLHHRHQELDQLVHDLLLAGVLVAQNGDLGSIKEDNAMI